MEELNHLQTSCKGFKGHVTQLHSKIDDAMDSDFDNYTITSLNTTIKQIRKKHDRGAQVDKKIATLIDDALQLKSALLSMAQRNFRTTSWTKSPELHNTLNYVTLTQGSDHKHHHIYATPHSDLIIQLQCKMSAQLLFQVKRNLD